ncbi:MAG: TonB-dependent receptor [Saprospiraceae bacterium]|nr:TonB-dependent receptor [Saprospiraceae bacterium]
MRRYKFSLVILFLAFSFSLTIAQSVTGKLVLEDGKPKIGATVFIGINEAVSNARGIFRFYNIEAGDYTFKVEVEEGNILSLDDVKVTGEDQDLGEIEVLLDQAVSNATDIAIISISTADIGGGGDDLGQEYSSILSAGRDPFNAAAAYNLSSGRFYARGYNNEDRHVYLNGFAVNDLDDGRVLWGAWGGLNDVLRRQENSFTLQATSFGFGGVGGASYIDLRASSQRPGTKVVYNRSNRSYTNRFMVTHNSGQTESGWSYSLSASRRWGDSGYVEGTFYDAWSIFGSVEKTINDKHSLGLTVLAAPSDRGRFSGSVQEMYDIAGSNYYNANWGFQNGKVRNSRIYKTSQPIAILRHDWTINSKTTLTTSIAGQTGKFGTTRLDWYNANDPRPDYYRKLPSFYEADGLTDIAEDVRAKLTNNIEARQLDWDRMYFINQNRNVTIDNINGTEESITGKLAAYVVEQQRFDNDKFNFNAVLESLVSDRFTLNAGLLYQYENVHNFKVLDDLLGADFYINLDNFALRDFPGNTDIAQQDLQIPNRLVYEGDKFGWNYDIVTQKAGGWAQGQLNLRSFDLFAAVELTRSSFFREGFYQNGRFPDSSLGKSEVQSFFNYGLKSGITYKIDGRNYLYGVGTLRTRAPFSRFAYISPRTRNQVVKNLTSEKIRGGEVGYVFRYPGLKGRISAYYTEFADQIENNSFYNDQQRTFVNFVLAGVDKKHQGIEFGMEAKITSTLSVDFAAGIMANQYTSRPLGTYTQDNDAAVLAEDRVIYIKNFYVPGPQQAFSLGFDYRSPKYWFASLNLNHFRNIYLDFNPDRRTDETVGSLLLPDREETFNRVISQEKLPSQFTLDFFGGKSWRLDDKFLYLNISVNNILNNKGFVTGGFEQGRFDYEGFDVDRFPPRYFYAFGTTYSIGLTLRY